MSYFSSDSSSDVERFSKQLPRAFGRRRSRIGRNSSWKFFVSGELRSTRIYTAPSPYVAQLSVDFSALQPFYPCRADVNLERDVVRSLFQQKKKNHIVVTILIVEMFVIAPVSQFERRILSSFPAKKKKSIFHIEAREVIQLGHTRQPTRKTRSTSSYREIV